MPEDTITGADWEVFANYGRTMLAVQSFEFTLFQIVQLQDEDFPEEADFEEAWREHVEPLFKLTAGQLKGKLRGLDEELVGELEAAVTARNFLAHHFLFNYRLATVTGATDHRTPLAALAELQERFAGINRKLDSVAATSCARRGSSPTTPGISQEGLDHLLHDFRDEKVPSRRIEKLHSRRSRTSRRFRPASGTRQSRSLRPLRAPAPRQRGGSRGEARRLS